MKHKVFFLLLALLAISQAVRAFDFSVQAPSGQWLYFNIISGHVEVVRPGKGASYNGYVSGDLTIPDSVTYSGTTYAVTTIAIGAFLGSDITSVNIPTSITYIGEQAFLGCSRLTSITIPVSVDSIGGYAFEGCGRMTYANIPYSVT